MNPKYLFWMISTAAGITVFYMKWIRPWQLRWGATDEELDRAMPGDADVLMPSFDATRGVADHAPPEAIYPWIGIPRTNSPNGTKLNKLITRMAMKSTRGKGTPATKGCKIKKTSRPTNNMLAWKSSPAPTI